MAIKKKDAPFQPSGDTVRIISLANGTWAYLFNHLGKTYHLPRNSAEFANACRETDEAMNGKITLELKALGWTDIIEKIENMELISEEAS